MESNPKAARRSPTTGDAPSKVARDASKDGGSMGACSRTAQGSLQSISRLQTQTRVSIFAKPKLMDPHQEMNPRFTENDTKLSKNFFLKAEIQMPAGKFLSNIEMLSTEVFWWLTGLIKEGGVNENSPSTDFTLLAAEFIAIPLFQ